jgi:ubiquinone/menaquinone biosynthesis C-methylase UbiE
MTRAVPQPFVHAMMPVPDHDEHAREDFFVGLKLHMMEHAYPYDDLVYERRAKPKFIKAKGRAPKDCDEVHDLMMDDDFTKLWSGIARNMQEMLWANAGDIAARQLPRLEAEARKQTASPRGTLTLDPHFKMPNYVEAVDIHCMPGGYQTDLGEDDLYVAAMYERGAYYYTTGMSGRRRDGAGKALVNGIKRFFPDLNPTHILDVGCTTGGSTIPIAEAWPEAEVHAIDVGAAILRFGHARAEALGRKIHFSQQNAEHTNFPDGYFDLVISGGMFHETSAKAARNIVKEMHRVVRPGGAVFNQDIPYGGAYSLHDQFMLNWDCYYNAEPFWRQWTAIDRTEFLATAGFERKNIVESWAGRDGSGNFTFYDTPFDESFPNARGGIGRVQFFGARK